METESCPDCGQAVIVALAEPDARPIRLDSTARSLYRLVHVTQSEKHAIALPTPVHELHILTCSQINKNG